MSTRARADSDAELTVAIETAESELGDSGRVLLRPSGTESLVRVMVEAETYEAANEVAHRLAEVVKSSLALWQRRTGRRSGLESASGAGSATQVRLEEGERARREEHQGDHSHDDRHDQVEHEDAERAEESELEGAAGRQCDLRREVEVGYWLLLMVRPYRRRRVGPGSDAGSPRPTSGE